MPEFWDWLVYQGEEGIIKIPAEIYDEITDPNKPKADKDELTLWADDPDVKKALLLDEEFDSDLLKRITYGGYTKNPTEDDLVTMGRDPFLLSYALKEPDNRTIVTMEVSKPTKEGANRRIPDVAKEPEFKLRCIDLFQMTAELKFSTQWKS